VEKQDIKKHKVSFIPHIGIDSEVLKNICFGADFNYIVNASLKLTHLLAISPI